MDLPYGLDESSGFPGVHQTSLLPPGEAASYPRYANGMHLADQIERGGAQIEETLSRLHCRYNSLCFIASWAVIISGFLGFLVAVVNLQLANLVNSIFLILFGVLLMILDIPGNPRWAGVYRRSIRKYARFLTRFTGKALWLLYLSCMVVVCLWPGRHSKRSNLQLLLAVLLSAFTMIVSLVGLFVALRKSLRFEHIRKQIQANYQGNWSDLYRKYAVNDPAHGMQYEEVNRMVSDVTGGRVLFDLQDLSLIFNALDDNQKAAINEFEFGNWAAAGIPGDDYGAQATYCCALPAMTFL